MIKVKFMLVNRILRTSFIFAFGLVRFIAQAQDVLPLPMTEQTELVVIAPLNRIFEKVNLEAYQVRLPEVFTGVQQIGRAHV